VHPDPLPALKQTYTSTLEVLAAYPTSSSYRQAAEAITRSRLKAVEMAGDDVQRVEQAIGGGQIEEILDSAQDELSLVQKLKDLGPYVFLPTPPFYPMLKTSRWAALEEAPRPEQWKYFGEETAS
jgi:NADH dehydrogenase (ubiquinone) 1 alpha subcomplex subunit 5